MKLWSVYIVTCRDGKLYTGISNDVQKRVATHNKGKGCRFTKYRYPVRLAYTEICGTKSSARKKELKIQSFTRAKKLKLITRKGETKGPSVITNAPIGRIGNIASGLIFASRKFKVLRNGKSFL